MTSVGETLRAERLRRNLALDQISNELKISARFLGAIEAGEYNKLPGGVFIKSFVRQYARLLGLDEEELAGQVQRMLEPPPDLPQPVKRPKLIDPTFHVPKMEEWESIGEKRFRWSGSLSAAALFVVALLICSGVYTWMQRPRGQATVASDTAPPLVKTAPPPPAQTVSKPVESPAETAETAAASPGEKPTQPPSEAAASAQTPVATAPHASDAISPVSQAAQSDRNATIHVEVTADEPVWVLARTDGKYLFSGTLEANQSRTVEGTDSVLLRLGNAGGVTITLNGKPIGPVGPKGQVRTVQFTSGGFQIVPVKPPAVLEPL